ncbi:uncharacterized protein LOC129775634 isoform X2 [Toxorhynchites rutilus septentrionalis]|uniref:uncharacterized protein LOC129775634 isoform X2 n=1 Tax=Toxorhynchites rutilus septentrionalis TaxID=329112 RepID=UPI0024789E57|nr:uncharacterized protein LOC129775634 isoform X2 [Toxorhynchites rutilus septentrionalis]
MSQKDGPDKYQQKNGEARHSVLPKAPTRRVIISKSRYKIYDQPKKSTLAVHLDNIKRERLSTAFIDKSSQAEDRESVSSRQSFSRQAGPSTKSFFTREDSSMELAHKKHRNLREVYSDYMKRRDVVPRRIRIVKIYVPPNWQAVLEESIRKYNSTYKDMHPWRQPRLLWLEQLERENAAKSQKPSLAATFEDDDCLVPCCSLFIFPFRRQRTLP